MENPPLGQPSDEDRPKLRPLEGFAIDHDHQKMLALRDPSGLSPHVAQLPPLAVAVIQLCDGESTRDQICEEFFRRYQRRLEREALDGLLSQLDQALLLDSAHFREEAAKIFAEFARAEVRSAVHAGKSYPEEADKLIALLNQCYDPPHGPGRPQPGSGPLPKAIIAPHIDFQRGGPAYAWAYRPLAEASEQPDLIILFGTDHNGIHHPFTLTKKHYDTPLGRLTTDGALVDELRKHGGGEALLADERNHRGEHSLEFQAVWLRHILGSAMDSIPVLPILCGSMHHFIESADDPAAAEEVGGFLGALHRAVAGRRVLWIAGADLAHIGPRFGDGPLTQADRSSLEQSDQAALQRAAAGDATGWFQEIRREKDRRRVCGLSPVYALLSVAQPGRGRLAAYGQCAAEEDSIVSIASLTY